MSKKIAIVASQGHTDVSVVDNATGAGIPLPSWTDTASVISYLTTTAGAVFAIITALHPGYTEPPLVEALLPSVGAVIAGVSQIVNVVTHRSALTKIAVAAIAKA